MYAELFLLSSFGIPSLTLFGDTFNDGRSEADSSSSGDQ